MLDFHIPLVGGKEIPPNDKRIALLIGSIDNFLLNAKYTTYAGHSNVPDVGGIPEIIPSDSISRSLKGILGYFLIELTQHLRKPRPPVNLDELMLHGYVLTHTRLSSDSYRITVVTERGMLVVNFIEA